MSKHSPQQVAATLKELFRKNKIQLTSFAREKGVTPTQLYSVLNGQEYIPTSWALKFNSTLGVNIFYSVYGEFPVMDPDRKYDLLLEAATSYKEAVEMVDRLNEEYAVVADGEKDILGRAMRAAMKRKMECSEALGALLKEEWNEDSEEVAEAPVIGPLSTTPSMKLHEAISEVIRRAGHPLTYTEIANAINAGKLYSRKDGAPVPASQISARVKNYPHLFRICSESGTSKIDTINQ